jgi:DNA-binding MarR family transcriptional regulator
MSTFLSMVKGFTPIIDALAQETSLTTAAVYGVVWRYCQMDDRICRASVETIAARVGISRKTADRHLKILVERGYLEDTTPDRRNAPHIYRDTGRAKIIGLVEARVEVGQNDPPIEVGQNDQPVGQNDQPRLVKMSNEESIKKEKKRQAGSGESSPVADYLEDVVSFASKELKKNDERQRGYRDATEEEYRICQRVADLWMGGKLQHFARDIEKAIAGANYILQLHDNNLRAALWTIDEYHAAQGGEGPTITSPHSLRNVLPGFMAKRGQSEGPIRISR